MGGSPATAYHPDMVDVQRLEREVASAWTTAVGHADFGPHDNFFEIGGDSVAATRVVASLQETVDVPIELVDAFRHPTVTTLAARISELLRSGASVRPIARLPRR